MDNTSPLEDLFQEAIVSPALANPEVGPPLSECYQIMAITCHELAHLRPWHDDVTVKMQLMVANGRGEALYAYFLATFLYERFWHAALTRNLVPNYVATYKVCELHSYRTMFLNIEETSSDWTRAEEPDRIVPAERWTSPSRLYQGYH